MNAAPALASGGINATAITITLGIIFIIAASIAVIVWSIEIDLAERIHR